MLKIAIAFLICLSFLEAIQNIQPTYSLIVSGDVQDMVYQNKKLYIATSEGSIDIFNTETKKRITQIYINKIKDFMGDNVAAKLYSIDVLKNNILVVSQGMQGYRNLWLYKNNKFIKLLGIKKQLFIKKAKFISKDLVLIATLSNEIILYSIKNNKYIYTIQISASSFSDFALDKEKKHIATTDESGIIRFVNVYSGKIDKIIGSKNLDRVYQLDYKNNVVLTAGQDRRSVIYNKNTTKELNFQFLLYSCGLSPQGDLGAIAYNEQNDIVVFQTDTLNKIYNLTQNKATLTKILFIDDKQLFASSDSTKINYWRLP